MNKKKVLIIGAGLIGKSIGYLLKEKGYRILGFISRSLSSAQAGIDLVGEGIASIEYGDFILEADLILITTSDASIKEVGQRLWKMNLVKKGASLIHLSGAKTSDILFSEKVDKNRYGRVSIHPLQSIASVEKGIVTLPESFFTIEGNQLGLHTAKEIMGTLGTEYKVISQEVKPIYHAAACIASNYLLAIIDLAIALNQEIEISSEKSVEGLLKLVQGTIDNIKELGTTAALTGPIVRGDKDTVKGHIDALQELLTAKELRIYQHLGDYTLGIAQRREKLTSLETSELKKILNGVGE